MKKYISFFGFLVSTSVLLLFVSCSQRDDSAQLPPSQQAENPNENPDGNLKYSISGNFSGTLDFTEILHNNMPVNTTKIETLPWETTYQVPDTSSFVGGYINGFYGDGMPDEEVNFKMYYKDRLIETVERKANDDGHINLPMEVLFFQTHNPDKTINDEHLGKTVRYEAETNFDRPFNIRYKVADGSWANITLDSFPWSYSFETEERSLSAALYTYELIGNELDGIMNQNDTITYRLFIDDIAIKTAVISKIGPETFFSDGQIHYDFD